MTPESLLSAAGMLRGGAAEVSRERGLTEAEATRLAQESTGEAVAALLERLRLLDAPLMQREQQMTAVADILAQTGALAGVLARAVAAVEPYVDTSPAARRILGELNALGTALDIACARQIALICTPLADPGAPSLANYPDQSPEEIHEINLLTASDEIRELAAQHPDLRILETPEGGLVASVGDLETADSVITFVAGVGSSDPNGWSAQVDRTRDLARATGGAGVLWLGYPAPPTLAHGLQHEPAAAAGRELARFQDELARRYPGQQRYVLGYSYGSVVVGEAAQVGLRADDVVFVASPGVGVGSVADMTLRGDDPQVHVLASRGDPIGLLSGPAGGIHGRDPASPGFGARVWDPGVTGGHNSYFSDPDFLAAVGEAVRAP